MFSGRYIFSKDKKNQFEKKKCSHFVLTKFFQRTPTETLLGNNLVDGSQNT